MNRLHSAYLSGEVGYEHVLAHDDASDLVQRLAAAAWYQQRQTERFQKGEMLPEDLEGPPEV